MVIYQEQQLSAGVRIGRYILREKIGQGTSAEVWKADHCELPGRVVAVKIATDPAFRRQLSRESRLPDLSHPNIVPILDSETRFHDPPYLVTPLLPDNLADLIARHPYGLPEEQVEKVTRGMLAGLAAAHRKGIKHRDLKPHNVLLDEAGCAKLADFGLSLHDSRPDLLHSIAQSGSFDAAQDKLVGTLAYMAPEVRDGQPATPAADVHAVGVILSEMVAGRRLGPTELPSVARTRKDLRRGALWDALYYGACQPLDKRYVDGGAMLAAMENGPQPVPFGPAQPINALKVPVPAPLPADRWEGLGVRWNEYKQAGTALSNQRSALEKTLVIYAEHHPEVRALQAQVEQLEVAQCGATERLVELRDRILGEVAARVSSLENEWANRVAKGFRPKHPEMERLGADLNALRELHDRVRQLPNPSSPLISAWCRWTKLNRKSEFELKGFLRVYGATAENPWAANAEAELARIARQRRRREQWAAGRPWWGFVLLGALIGGLVGVVVGAGAGITVFGLPSMSGEKMAFWLALAIPPGIVFLLMCWDVVEARSFGWWGLEEMISCLSLTFVLEAIAVLVGVGVGEGWLIGSRLGWLSSGRFEGMAAIGALGLVLGVIGGVGEIRKRAKGAT